MALEKGTHDGTGDNVKFNDPLADQSPDSFEYSRKDVTPWPFDGRFYRYTLPMGPLVPKTGAEVQAIIDAEEAAEQADQERRAEIDAVKEAEGLKKYTMAQATSYLQNKLDTTEIESAADLEELKTALVANNTKLYQVFMKMFPYLMD